MFGLAGGRRDLREVKDDAQDDHHARRHALQCTFYSVRPLHPRDSEEDDDFHVPLLMYTAPPCDYKRRRRTSFKGGRSGHQRPSHPHSRSSSPLSTTENTLQPIPPLTETWEHPSFSRLACTPYYKHSGCKIIQCPRTPLCWTYGPAARTRIKPVRYCVASCINIWDEKTRSIY